MAPPLQGEEQGRRHLALQLIADVRRRYSSSMDLTHHAPKFPPDMADYFNSTWNKRQLWETDFPSARLPLEELRWHLNYPFWSSSPPGPRFDLRPRCVIEGRRMYLRHWERVLAADVQFPIEVAPFGSRLVILDGLHRLAKSILEGASSMACRLVPSEYIEATAFRASSIEVVSAETGEQR